MEKLLCQIGLVAIIIFGLIVLLSYIIDWKRMSKHPKLFTWWHHTGSFGEDLRTPEYDPDIKKEAIVKVLILIAVAVFGLVMTFIRE